MGDDVTEEKVQICFNGNKPELDIKKLKRTILINLQAL
jgi:hypothetical protein